MSQVISVLFGSLFTVVTALAIGLGLFRVLGLSLYRLEEPLLAFVVGSACLSELVFFLATMHLAKASVFVVAGVAALAWAAWSGGLRRAEKGKLPAVPPYAVALFAVVFVGFAYWYLPNALAPEVSPDGSTYHLGTVLRYYRAHGFVRLPNSIYANLSSGLELLFLFAFVFGKNSAAAMVHFAYLVALPLLMVCYGRRIGRPLVGVAGALFFYVAPVVGMDGSIAYNDVAAAAVGFSLFYFLDLWLEGGTFALLVPVGILAGWAYAVKYTAAVAIPYALGVLLWRLVRRRQAVLRPLATVSGIAALFVLPWMVKNLVWMDNPLAPFFNRWFPNPYVHISFEDTFRLYQRLYTLNSNWQIPLDLTVHGAILAGLYGPLFLLTPLAVLAVRWPAGRRLLLAMAVFALPYATNVGARFLIPCAPYLCLSLALVFSFVQWLPLVLVAAHAVSCWPAVLRLYCAPYAWHIAKAPWRAALRLDSDEYYLQRSLYPEFAVARMINEKISKDKTVFAFSEPAIAYTDRNVFSRYQGAFNEVIGDLLWMPLFPDFQPTVKLDFAFSARQVRFLRVLETNDIGDSQWSVAEIRLLDKGMDLARGPEWRLTAKPNPWDVQMAFDNSPVSRWRTWEGGRPGMYVEVDLGKAREVDAVSLLTSPDAEAAQLRVEAQDKAGKWVTVSSQPVRTMTPLQFNVRRAAMQEAKAKGVDYVSVKPGDLRAEDYIRYQKLWGLRKLGEVGGTYVFQIE